MIRPPGAQALQPWLCPAVGLRVLLVSGEMRQGVSWAGLECGDIAPCLFPGLERSHTASPDFQRAGGGVSVRPDGRTDGREHRLCGRTDGRQLALRQHSRVTLPRPQLLPEGPPAPQGTDSRWAVSRKPSAPTHTHTHPSPLRVPTLAQPEHCCIWGGRFLPVGLSCTLWGPWPLPTRCQ